MWLGDPLLLTSCLGRMDVDLGDDGSVEWQWTYRFDNRGRMVTADGLALFGGEGRPRMAYYYDTDGNLSSRQWFGVLGLPASAGVGYRYRGRHILERYDTANGGTITRFTWEGDQLVRTVESHLDGRAAETQTLTWEAGRLLTAHIDSDTDGRPEVLVRYTYDDAGRIDGRTFDTGLDGTVERAEAEVWGADGRLSERRRDTDADGHVDDRFAISWKCPSGT